MIAVGVEPGSDFDTPSWQAHHRAGNVPDVSPYGLERMSEHGVKVRTLGPNGPATGWRGRALAVALERSRVDVVPLTRRLGGLDVLLTMHEKRGLSAVLAAAPRRLPVISGLVWLAGDAEVSPGVLRALTAVLRRTSALWVYSTSQVGLIRGWGVPADRVHYVRFGVNAEWWTPGGVVDPELLVAAGTDRDRDYPALLGAFSRLRATRPGLRLIIAGPRNLPATAGVSTPGPVPHLQLRELYRQAAVVVVPTRHNEHVSGITSALEAMCCGRPVVTMDTPGFSDYVDSGRTGELVPVGDVEAFVSSLRGLLAEPDRAAALGASARVEAARSFTHDTLAEQLADIAKAVAR